MNHSTKHFIIIGNGIAGITAARHLRKLDSAAKITVISSETPHFFSRTALMYVYMGQMKFEHTKPYPDDFWKKNRIELRFEKVNQLSISNEQLAIETEAKKHKDVKSEKWKVENLENNHSSLITHQRNAARSSLIIATGSKPKRLNVKGEDAQGVQGLYSYQDLCLMEENTKDITEAIVVGGGLIGIELVEMLISRKIKVTFLVREDSFWNTVLPAEESSMLNRHIREHGVDLRLGTEVKGIIADENERVKCILTQTGEEIPVQFVGVAVGVSPNIDFLKGSGIDTDKGVLVDEYLQTNLPNVYAIGDCVQHRNPPNGRRSIEQIWYSGRAMGEVVAENILGNNKPYKPDIFFNSAKFFDIEYQTYGNVPAKTPDGVSSFYWEHPKGKKSVRLNYDTERRRVLGVNTFGIRMRQAVWQDWIRSEKSIDFVLENLEKANFDPEFSEKYENNIRKKFNSSLSA